MKNRFCQLNSKEGIFGIIISLILIVTGIVLAVFSNEAGTIALISILLVCLIGMMIYELFFSNFISLNEDKLVTNNDIITDVEKYKNRLFKTVTIEYKDIKSVEEVIIGEKKRINFYTKRNDLVQMIVKYKEEKVFAFLNEKINKN